MNLAAIYQPLLIIAAALAGIILGSVAGFREAAAHIITPALAALLYMSFSPPTAASCVRRFKMSASR